MWIGASGKVKDGNRKKKQVSRVIINIPRKQNVHLVLVKAITSWG